MKAFTYIVLVMAIIWGAYNWYTVNEQKKTIATFVEAVEQQNVLISKAIEAYTSLKGYYDQLGSDYEKLRTYYDQLQQDYTQSQQEVANLAEEVLNLENQVMIRIEAERKLQKQIATNKAYYQTQIKTAQREAEEAKFEFYYVPMEQRYGVDDLKDYIQRWKWKEGTYIENQFDCSQMSAYLEWKLENEGYHTVIVGGKSPDGSGRHAWLLVETTKGKYMPVEATAYKIVYWGSPYFDKYYEYEVEFEDIHEALLANPTEFNWWDLGLMVQSAG